MDRYHPSTVMFATAKGAYDMSLNISSFSAFVVGHPYGLGSDARSKTEFVGGVLRKFILLQVSRGGVEYHVVLDF